MLASIISLSSTMNRLHKTIIKDKLWCSILTSSGFLPKVSKAFSLATNSQSVGELCCGCGRNVQSKSGVLFQERGFQHLVKPSARWLSLGQSSSSHVVVFGRLQRVLGLHNLPIIPSTSLAFNKNFILSRQSLNTRTFSATASAQAASTLAVNSSSSNELLLFSDFFPVYGAEKGIEYIHQLTGLPWWSTIVVTAFLLRVVLLLPITIHSFHNIARLQNLQPEVEQMSERLKKEVAMAMHQFKWDEKRAKQEYAKNLKRLLKELYIRDNCHPMKGVATFWIQLPVWISVSYALRNLSMRAVHPNLDGHVNLQCMSEQGLAWFPDLTAADSTWLLPVLMGTVTLINTEVNYLSIPEITKYRRWLTYGLRGLSLVFIPICAAMPSSMVLYWVCSGTFGAVQNLLFDYSPFRRLVGLPKTNIESHSPLRALGQRAITRYWKK